MRYNTSVNNKNTHEVVGHEHSHPQSELEEQLKKNASPRLLQTD